MGRSVWQVEIPCPDPHSHTSTFVYHISKGIF